jgi:hypothetical protein
MSAFGADWAEFSEILNLEKFSYDLMVEIPAGADARQASRMVRACVLRLASAIGEQVLANAGRIRSLIENNNTPPSLFWFVPSEIRLVPRIPHQVNSSIESDLGYGDLAGKSIQTGNAFDVVLAARRMGTNDNFVEFEFAVVSVDVLSFEAGSLYTWMKGHVEVLTLGATLLAGGAAIAAGPVDDFYKHAVHVHEFHQKVESALQNQPMVTYRGFTFDESQLNWYAGNSFNYEQKGISDDEKRHRIRNGATGPQGGAGYDSGNRRKGWQRYERCSNRVRKKPSSPSISQQPVYSSGFGPRTAAA